MKKKTCYTFVLLGLLLASGAFAAKPAYAQEWYPGEGAQQGLLVKYRISSIDYKAGQPFLATIWFESQDENKNWNTFVIIEEEGRVVTSDMKLSSLNLTPTGFDVTEEFKPYRAAIKDTLAWIGGYASRVDPKSFSEGAWGIIAAIGGGGIVVGSVGSETLQLAGRSWDTTIVGFHYAVDSAIWVSDEFPVPLKAKVFALTTQLPVPVMFEFDLMETAMTDTRPVPPESEVRIPVPPLSKPTTSSSFVVDLWWEPETIEPGAPVTFGAVIFDSRGNKVKDPQYAMLIVDGEGNTVADIKRSLGEESHEVTFESVGDVEVTVTYLGSLALPMEEKIIEKAKFELLVIPEFPLGAAAVMAALVATIIAVTRFGKTITVPKL